MNSVPPAPAGIAAWVASLSETEAKSVYETVVAASELRALAGLAGARQVSSNFQPAPAAPSTAPPKPAPRPATIHPYFGWREAKKWILVGIARSGGSAPTAEVIDFVYTNIGDELLPEDLEPTDETPEPRWRNRVRWERENLADQGYLHRGPRGAWTLTEKGRRLMDLR